MIKIFFFGLLILASNKVFSQSEFLDNCEIPYTSDGQYITLEPMTGLIYDKESKMFSYCDDPKTATPKHFASVDLSTSKLDIRVYDVSGKLLKATYLINVSFHKDFKLSQKLLLDPLGHKWSQKNVFILKTDDPKVGGEVTIQRQLGNQGSIIIKYHYLNSQGEKTTEYNVSTKL